MKKKFISEFKDKEKVDSYFMVRKKNLKLTKYDKPYLEISLSDKTGKIEARLWDNAEDFNDKVEVGDVAHVKGTIEKYKDDKQLKLDSMEKADDRAYRYEDMVRVVEHREEIYQHIREYLSRIKNPWLKALSDRFTGDEELMNRFHDGIGAKNWHNAYIGGLSEHTFEVMCVVDRVCDLYPEADREIAIFGAFIHDIGKVYELDPKKMEYTIEGGLIGHIPIGHKILIKKIEVVENFPQDLSLRLEHIILSHHGEYEQQSPVLPKTLEATIIYQADELVSQANAIKEIKLSQGEDGKIWSDFVSIKNRKYYIKHAADEDWARVDLQGSRPDTHENNHKVPDNLL